MMITVNRSRALLGGLALGAAVLAGLAASGRADAVEASRRVPAPTVAAHESASKLETAVLAGGCFWGVQGVFQHVKGVTSAVSGYAGGEGSSARYEEVGSGRTGHAEAVRISYDPSVIGYGDILQIYFSVAHDPTELNRQGPDTGTQYRSTIFPVDKEQARVAGAYVQQLEETKAYADPIVTTIEPGKDFFPAEGYHQDFLALNPTYPYIVYNDLPKIEDLHRLFPERFRDAPVLTADAETAVN